MPTSHHNQSHILRLNPVINLLIQTTRNIKSVIKITYTNCTRNSTNTILLRQPIHPRLTGISTPRIPRHPTSRRKTLFTTIKTCCFGISSVSSKITNHPIHSISRNIPTRSKLHSPSSTHSGKPRTSQTFINPLQSTLSCNSNTIRRRITTISHSPLQLTTRSNLLSQRNSNHLSNRLSLSLMFT